MGAARSRRHERPRSSRLQHSASFRAGNPNKASMTLMLAAASIKVMDALFGFPARNDAECCKRELLGRSWRRDRAAPKNGAQILGREKTLVTQSHGFARRTSRLRKSQTRVGPDQGLVTSRAQSIQSTKKFPVPQKSVFGSKFAHGPISTPSPSQKL